MTHMHRCSFMSVLVVLLYSAAVLADTSTQSDWSSGGGVGGPVTEWGGSFSQGYQIQPYTCPSNLILFKSMASTPVMHFVDDSFDGARYVRSADMNGDGITDVVAAAYTSQTVSWWENSSTSPGTDWTEHVIDDSLLGPFTIGTADIDGDGDIDVIGPCMFMCEYYWWENQDGSGTSWARHTIGSTLNDAMAIASADVDGDGDQDVLGGGGYQVKCWRNNGSGTGWDEFTVDVSFNGIRSICTGDIDGDGSVDAAGGACFYNDDVSWWENISGTGSAWLPHLIDGTNKDANSVHCADVNSDGYLDVLAALFYDSDEIIWWENEDGSGTSWTEHVVDGSFDRAYSVSSADVNGDGRLDVVGAAHDAGEIAWWENLNGSGTSWSKHTLTDSFGQAYCVHTADVNEDGYSDVIGASQGNDDIAWWDMTGEYSSSGYLESSILDVQEDRHWQDIDWDCSQPSGTTVAFQVRTSGNPSSMGAWSDTLYSPCSLTGIVSDSTRYFQYRAILGTSDVSVSPFLHDITVTWNPLGIEHEIEHWGSIACGSCPNPASGGMRVVFTLIEAGEASIEVFDLTGRAVASAEDSYDEGEQELVLTGLHSGVYFVRVTSGGRTGSCRSVVVE